MNNEYSAEPCKAAAAASPNGGARVEKFVGVLIAGCVGDVLGSQNEGLTRAEIIAKGKSVDLPSNGAKYTDDTELTICLAKHLVQTDGNVYIDGVHDLYASVIRTSARGYSRRTRTILCDYKTFVNTGTAATNGGLMRISPLALIDAPVPTISYEAIRSKIRYATYYTHGNNPESVDVCYVHVAFLRFLMSYESNLASKPLDRSDASSALLEITTRVSNTALFSALQLSVIFALTDAKKRDDEDDDITLKLFGLVNHFQIDAKDCYACAVYFFIRYVDNPERGIIAAANCGGDTDTIAKIVGELYGAMYGFEWIPERWWRKHEGFDELLQLAYQLYKMSTKTL